MYLTMTYWLPIAIILCSYTILTHGARTWKLEREASFPPVNLRTIQEPKFVPHPTLVNATQPSLAVSGNINGSLCKYIY